MDFELKVGNILIVKFKSLQYYLKTLECILKNNLGILSFNWHFYYFHLWKLIAVGLNHYSAHSDIQPPNGGEYNQEYYAESYADDDGYEREDVNERHISQKTQEPAYNDDQRHETTGSQQAGSPSTPNTYHFRFNGQNSSYINWSAGLMSTNEHQTYAGYLKKQGALFKQWKERYFVLDSIKHQVMNINIKNHFLLI